MAMDMFIKIKDIKGESKDKSHKDEIDVLAWSWGMSNSGDMHTGGGGGAGKVNVQDVSFTKYQDASTCALMEACCKGTHIGEALLTVRKAGDKPLEYLKIKLTDILVSGQQFAGHGGDLMTENLTLNFAKFQVEYYEQKPDGSQGTKKDMGWDIKKNEKV